MFGSARDGTVLNSGEVHQLRPQPEPCNDKGPDKAGTVVTIQLPGKTPRCEIKDTSTETKLSAACIGQRGNGKPEPIEDDWISVSETPTGVEDGGSAVQPPGRRGPKHK